MKAPRVIVDEGLPTRDTPSPLYGLELAPTRVPVMVKCSYRSVWTPYLQAFLDQRYGYLSLYASGTRWHPDEPLRIFPWPNIVILDDYGGDYPLGDYGGGRLLGNVPACGGWFPFRPVSMGPHDYLLTLLNHYFTSGFRYFTGLVRDYGRLKAAIDAMVPFPLNPPAGGTAEGSMYDMVGFFTRWARLSRRAVLEVPYVPAFANLEDYRRRHR